jgi:energy-coupling factor transport system permease protein
VIINHGSTVLLEATFDIPTLGTPRITLEAIVFAVSMSLRLLVIVSSFAVFNFTIHPDDQLLAMIQLRLPYKSVLVTSLSSRFAPLLFEDLTRLTEVQRSRGMEMDKGRLHRRVWNRATLLVPLLANSLDRCVQIAEAMESRAFGQGTGRSYFRRLKLTQFDWLTLAIGFVPLAWGIAILVSGYGDYDAYSNWRVSVGGMEEYGIIVTIIVFSALLVLLGWLKRKVDLD